MEIAFIVLAIMALASYLEARHLSKNNIRKDEDIFYIICGVCVLAMLVLACVDGKEIFKFFE
jgi:formate hydrogenlyase subunit 3/multisubunit Na+/H+ antiporter MnhD subunit